jgi:hypothetical protein
VGALQDVDRIHLEQADAAEDPAQVPAVWLSSRVACRSSASQRSSAWARVGEALGGQGDPPCLRR